LVNYPHYNTTDYALDDYRQIIVKRNNFFLALTVDRYTLEPADLLVERPYAETA
jgi:hypothetical protein